MNGKELGVDREGFLVWRPWWYCAGGETRQPGTHGEACDGRAAVCRPRRGPGTDVLTASGARLRHWDLGLLASRTLRFPEQALEGAVTQVCWQAVEEQPSQCQRTGCCLGVCSRWPGACGALNWREPLQCRPQMTACRVTSKLAFPVRPPPTPNEKCGTGKHSSHDSVAPVPGHGDHCPRLDGCDSKMELAERLGKFTDKAVEPAQSKQQRENRLKRHRASDLQNSHLITRDLEQEEGACGLQSVARSNG